MSQAGGQIDGFIIDREVGRGGMGVVYLARDPRLARPVALKVLHTDAGPSEIERFHQEARTAAQLDHPNVVRVLSTGHAGGRPYLALEYVDGETLEQRLKRSGRLTPELAVRLLLPIVHGVSHAHQRGVIHRDIKPDNVLLVGDTPRLTDFGLARFGERHNTQTGQVMGTPAYMSPEQAAGEAARVGPLSDVYSLGVTLYTLLAGHPPFRGPSTIHILRQVLEDPPQPIPGVPRALNRIVQHALAKEPEQRTPSAAKLALELEGWARAGDKPERGPRWPLALAVCSTLVAGVVVNQLTSGQGPEVESAQDEPDKPAVDVARLADRVAAARDAGRLGEAQDLLAAVRAAGELAPELAFEAAYVDVLSGRLDQAVATLDALTPTSKVLASRAHALRALAHARRFEAEPARAAAAQANASDDWLTLRLLGYTRLEDARLRDDARARNEARALLERATAKGDPAPDTRTFALWCAPRDDARRAALRELVAEAPTSWASYALAHDLLTRRPVEPEEAQALAESARASSDPRVLSALAGFEANSLRTSEAIDLERVKRVQDLAAEAVRAAPGDLWVTADVGQVLLAAASVCARRYSELKRSGAAAEAQPYLKLTKEIVAQLEPILTQALAAHPDFLSAHKRRIECRRMLGKVEEAIAAVEALLAKHAADAELYAIYADCLLSANRETEALAALERAAAHDPDRYAKRVTKLRTSLRSPTRLAAEIEKAREARRWDEAERLIEESRNAEGLLPKEVAFEQAYVDLHLGHMTRAKRTARLLLKLVEGPLRDRTFALLALAEGRRLNWSVGAEAGKQALRAANTDWLVARLLGESLLLRGQLVPDPEAKARGVRLLQRALDLGDRRPDTLAFAIWGAGSPPDDAQRAKHRSMLEGVVGQAQSCPFACYLLAHNLSQYAPRDPARAVDLALSALKQAPRWGWLHARVARLLSNPKLWPALEARGSESVVREVTQLLERAWELEKSDPRVVEDVASTYLSLRNGFLERAEDQDRAGDAARAMSLRELAGRSSRRALGLLGPGLEAYPSFYAARRLRVDATRFLDPSAALELLSPLLFDYPERAELHSLRAMCLALQERVDESLEAMERAAQLNPRYQGNLENLRRRFGR